ncbi:hypothetical protein [Breoghania sp.]|uniref:hypothetical protein n=1 Tax=Breoghania sp. TaxID=2065378 RepID=UPI0026286CC5|nr:hypothetical protein [Breoghania sp.]MDJ0933471.1 hypothetical protein [Breoghania sp.]
MDPEALALAGPSGARKPSSAGSRPCARASGATEPVAGAREAAGSGVKATVGGVEWRLDSPKFCEVAPDLAASALERHPDASLIVLAREGAEPCSSPCVRLCALMRLRSSPI